MANNLAQLRDKRENLGLSQAKLSELSGISQHLLSAHELGKTQLNNEILEKINLLLNDSDTTLLVKRKKRYKEHIYQNITHDQNRVEKYNISLPNNLYLDLLKNLENYKNCTPSGIKAISLFSGCGGFSLGFKAAGINIEGFVEIDANLRRIYKANFPEAKEIGSDITKISDEIIQEIAKKEDIDILIGGPPCQGFSLSGKRKIDDPRNLLFKHYMRFLKILNPAVAVIENVKLLTSMKSQSGNLVKDEIIAAFNECGYQAQLFEINAKDFCVPQHRERVIFIAIRNDIAKKSGIKLSINNLNKIFDCKKLFTFSDACSDLKFLESGEKSADPMHTAVNHPKHVIDWLWDVPEGSSAHDNKDPNKRPPSGYNTTYKRQIWLEPASTVQTTFGMISGCRNVHPIATRALTIREAARIQSFPDNYIFTGNNGTIRTGIGNAVPPLLAYQLAIFFRYELF